MLINHTNRRAKIVATIGPASNTREKLRDLALAGVDVFRLNFSHGTHEVHANNIKLIREVNAELGTHICILQDLQGPKIRTNEVENGEVEVTAGDELVITTEDVVGNAQRISTSYKSMALDVAVGDSILVDDGKIELRVMKIVKSDVVTKVIHGGPIKSRKGINLPQSSVSAPSLTEKDTEDLKFGLKHDVDWIALSFVRKGQDITRLKEIIRDSGKDARVVAKIEKPEALRNIDDIIRETDAVMVARGDLGVEIQMEEVPIAQKMIVEKCKKAAVPVIIATQMMESMIENPRPTRAETSDVANGVMDGADAVMLSAETAAGKYPIEVVKSMAKTIEAVESRVEGIYNFVYEMDHDSSTYYNDYLVSTAAQLANSARAKAILGISESGYTALRIASHRPKSRIFIFTDEKSLLTRLNLIWGVTGFYYEKADSTDQMLAEVEEILVRKGHLLKDDVFITTGSMPFRGHGRTNMLKISTVSGE